MPQEAQREQRTLKSLDPRAPLVVDTRELGRRAGAMRKFSRTVPAPVNLGVEMLRVPEGSDVDVEFRLEAVVEGVLISGVTETVAVGECVRCLDPVEWDLEAEFQQLYVYHDAAPADEETVPIEGDLVDLEPVLRDAVVLALPLRPVCRDDCPGLCAECGARLADDPAHRHDVADPRWATLTKLTFGEKES